MRQITDYIILLLYSLLAQLVYTTDPAFVAVFFLTVCISTFIYVFPDGHLRFFLTAACAFLLFFVRETILFLPLILYFCLLLWKDERCRRRISFWFPAALCAAGAVSRLAASHDAALICFDGCGCFLSAVLYWKTVSYETLMQKYKKTRDDGTESALLLEEKNKSLLEKQDAQIYTATLKERNRIAREIHDNVGHLLTRSILMVGALKTVHTEASLAEPFRQLEDTLDSAMNSIRQSVHDLHDSSIDLKASLSALTDNFLFCPVTLQYDISPGSPADVRYCFIAVTKEALANIARHSNATQVYVTAIEHPAFYQLSVSDNGTDISPAFKNGVPGGAVLPPHSGGIGLSNMQTRVLALNGTFRINTGSGFQIFTVIPKHPS